MALAVDASTPAQAAGGTTTITTASFTAPANALLVAFNNCNSGSGVSNNMTVSDSGGLTWALVLRMNNGTGGAAGGGAEIWAATTSTSAARTVSAVESAALEKHSLVVKVFTDTGGAPTVGASARSTNSTFPTCNVTTTAVDSWVWATSSDWDTGGAGTAGSGQTITLADENIDANYTGHVWRRTATTPTASAVTLNLTAPSGRNDEVVIEVLANAGAVDILPEITQPPRRAT